MNFFLIVLYGYILIAVILIYLFNRDRKNKQTFLGRRTFLAWLLNNLLCLGICLVFYVRFVEPNIIQVKEQTIKINSELKTPLKIVFFSDLHVGENKKTPWTQKVVKKVIELQPDLILLGGDYVANDGTLEDESIYLEPLQELSKQFPIYYVMGNHEYGLYTRDFQKNPDKSEMVKKRMEDLGIPLLRNQLACPQIKTEKICIFGNDDVYRENYNFTDLQKRTTTTPLILLSHNPDAILYWKENIKKPDLELSGHTHGGQIYLPFIGPLGRVEVFLGPKYYRGLNYYNDVPVYTTLGLGESGGPIRFLSPPEITVINLTH